MKKKEKSPNTLFWLRFDSGIWEINLSDKFNKLPQYMWIREKNNYLRTCHLILVEMCSLDDGFRLNIICLQFNGVFFF